MENKCMKFIQLIKNYCGANLQFRYDKVEDLYIIAHDITDSEISHSIMEYMGEQLDIIFVGDLLYKIGLEYNPKLALPNK